MKDFDWDFIDDSNLCISILEFKLKEIADIIREDDEFMYFYIRI